MSIIVELPLAQYQRDAFAAFTPASGFNLGTARAAAWLARLSYESDLAKIDTVLAAWGLTRVARFANAATPIPASRTRGLAASGHDATLIAFAGTDPLMLANWITNFNTGLSPDDLHRGFAAAVESVWPQLQETFAAGGDTPLFIAGHSLGAALAVIAAARAAAEGVPARAVYAFGMPRAGGVTFAVRYPLGDVTYRLVHGEDIVPSVPPSELGFRHVGCLMRIPRGAIFDGAVLEPPGSDEPPFVASLIAGLKAALPDIGRGWPQPAARDDFQGWAARFLPPRIGDHLPDRYCRAFTRGES